MGEFMTHKKVGLMLSIAACAFIVGSQTKSVTQRVNEQGLSAELGLESAWPHLRADFLR